MKRPTAIFRVAACVVALLLAAAASPRAAMADSIISFVQITCAPELNYFSIRRFHVPSPGFDFVDRLSKSQRTTLNPLGIYTRSALEKAPFECDLIVATATGGKEPLRIRAVGFFKDLNVGTYSDRFISDYVEVSADGKKLGALGLNYHGFTAGYDLLEMFVDGTAVDVRKCSYDEFLAVPPTTICSTEQWH
jgi:hypothetical protein